LTKQTIINIISTTMPPKLIN